VTSFVLVCYVMPVLSLGGSLILDELEITSVIMVVGQRVTRCILCVSRNLLWLIIILVNI